MDLMEYVSANVRDKPKNFLKVIELVKAFQKTPNLSVERYCEILQISKPTFYRLLNQARTWGLVDDRFYKVNPAIKEETYTVERALQFVKEPYLPVEKLVWLVLNTKETERRVELVSRFNRVVSEKGLREFMALYSMVMGFHMAYKDLPVVDFSPSDDEINSILNELKTNPLV